MGISHILSSFSVRNDTGTSTVGTKLLPADTNELQHLPPEAKRLVQESSLVGIDGRALPDQIDLRWLDEAGAVDKLPAGEGDESCYRCQ